MQKTKDVVMVLVAFLKFQMAQHEWPPVSTHCWASLPPFSTVHPISLLPYFIRFLSLKVSVFDF